MRRDAIITLPSGRKARLIVHDPERPWEVYPHGKLYGLKRTRRGDSTEWEYFKNASAQVTSFDMTDIEFLLNALNSWQLVRSAFTVHTAAT